MCSRDYASVSSGISRWHGPERHSTLVDKAGMYLIEGTTELAKLAKNFQQCDPPFMRLAYHGIGYREMPHSCGECENTRIAWMGDRADKIEIEMLECNPYLIGQDCR
jgi:hypothetical protein